MMNKEAVNNVTFSISGAIDAVEAAIDRIEDCGLNDYELETAKEYLQEGIRRLDIAYDKVDFAED